MQVTINIDDRARKKLHALVGKNKYFYLEALSKAGTAVKKQMVEKSKRTGRVPTHARIYKDHRIRKLTPTECERLQGFPDGWTKGVSDTQRYKQLGNAVTATVVEYIAQYLDE